MDKDEFSFKFPEFDFTDLNPPAINKNTIDKINEYLDADIKDQITLLNKLVEFEKKIDDYLFYENRNGRLC